MVLLCSSLSFSSLGTTALLVFFFLFFGLHGCFIMDLFSSSIAREESSPNHPGAVFELFTLLQEEDTNLLQNSPLLFWDKRNSQCTSSPNFHSTSKGLAREGSNSQGREDREEDNQKSNPELSAPFFFSSLNLQVDDKALGCFWLILLLLSYNSFSCFLHSAASRSSARDLLSVSVFMSSSKRSSFTKLLCHHPVIATTIAVDSSRVDHNELGAEELCLSLFVSLSRCGERAPNFNTWSIYSPLIKVLYGDSSPPLSLCNRIAVNIWDSAFSRWSRPLRWFSLSLGKWVSELYLHASSLYLLGTQSAKTLEINPRSRLLPLCDQSLVSSYISTPLSTCSKPHQTKYLWKPPGSLSSVNYLCNLCVCPSPVAVFSFLSGSSQLERSYSFFFLQLRDWMKAYVTHCEEDKV